MNLETDNGSVLREWLSLSNITRLIPNKSRKGLILQDVQFTCIDAANEFLAIGTNVGVVFWCNRVTLKVTPYNPGKTDFGITCLKLVDSVDYMLAVGDKLGIISIFKIPKELPKDLPEEYQRRYDSKTEVFTVGGIHKTQITSLEWSLNGEKLFSGDVDGVVGFTQMDFYMNLTKSCEILKEGYRIIQLSFHNNQNLLVSSLLRSVILYKNENWKVVQVGQKDRKTLAELGAVFNTKSSTSASPPLIYATRHGQRIWIADTSGVVQKTLLFKDLLSLPYIPRIKHLNSYDGLLSCENFEFSTLHVFHSRYLVSHSSNLLVVINPDTSAVVGVLRSYAGIQSLAVSRDEMFLLEGSRGVRRLSFVQDPYVARQKASESDVLGDAMLDFAVKLKGAASAIAPLLKDYTEASPASRLNSPEVDYDVGIAEEIGEVKDREREIKATQEEIGKGQTLKEHMDKTSEEETGEVKDREGEIKDIKEEIGKGQTLKEHMDRTSEEETGEVKDPEGRTGEIKAIQEEIGEGKTLNDHMDKASEKTIYNTKKKQEIEAIQEYIGKSRILMDHMDNVSEKIIHNASLEETNVKGKDIERDANKMFEKESRTFKGEISNTFDASVKEEAVTVAQVNEPFRVSEDENSISTVIQNENLTSTVTKDSIPIVIQEKKLTSSIAEDNEACSIMTEDKESTSTVTQEIQSSTSTSSQSGVLNLRDKGSESTVSQDEIVSTSSAQDIKDATSALSQDTEPQNFEQQAMPPSSIDSSTRNLSDQTDSAIVKETEEAVSRIPEDQTNETVDATMLGLKTGASVEPTKNVVIVRYFKNPSGTQSKTIETQTKRTEEPQVKTIEEPKPVEGTSKESTLPAKSRQSALKDLGSKEYGDLVFKSSRTTKKSAKVARKKPATIGLIGGASGSTADVDSDTASVLSEADMMTVSQTSSTGEFDNSKSELSNGKLTNEELEAQVAKMLSLEDVLINPPPLKTAPVVSEDDSRLRFNFVDTSLSNGSSSSDLTTVNSVQPTPTVESVTQSTTPVDEVTKLGYDVLNFNLDHFGASEQVENAANSDDLISTTSYSGSAKVDSGSVKVDKINEVKNLVRKEKHNDTSDSSKCSPKQSPEKTSVTISHIESKLQQIEGTILDSYIPNRANVESKEILSKTINDEPDSTNDVVANSTSSQFDGTLIEDFSFDSEIPNLVIVTKDLQGLNTPPREKDCFDSDDVTNKRGDTLHKSDSLSKNLPDLLSSVDDSNCGSNAAESYVCDCRSETSKAKGYLSAVGPSWHCCTTPNTCVWLGMSCHKLYCGGPRLSVYEADLRESSLEWKLMDQKATFMTVSPCGRYIWRSNLGVVSSLAPSSDKEWQVCARDVDSASLTSALAWYTSQGKVYTQVLPQSVPTLVPCSLHIVRIVSSENRVWALSDQGKILSRENIIPGQNPRGESWSSVLAPPDLTISDIALTHNGLGWIIDRSNYIHFYLSTPLSSPSPLVTKPPTLTPLATKSPSSSGGGEWWQLLIEGNFSHETLHTASAQKPYIRSVPGSLWISHPLASVVYVSTSSVQGHRWSTLELGPSDPVEQASEMKGGSKDPASSVKWKKISAEGLFEDDGYIWLLSSAGALYNYCPYSRELSEVPPPVEDNENQIASIEASPNALWVLTEKAEIYIRRGISTVHPRGLDWKRLPLEQFATAHVTPADLSCACDIVWVCSTRGQVFMTLCPPHEDREQIPAWIQAEGSALPGCTFSRIYVGPHAGMVWALDNRSNVYVREGIYHDYQLGVNWLYVPGLQATHLSISQSSVWALSRDTVYKRVGVSETNFIGAYWQRVPGRVSLLSTSLNDQVYGAVTRVVRHSSVTVRVEGEEERKRSGGGAGEWEIL